MTRRNVMWLYEALNFVGTIEKEKAEGTEYAEADTVFQNR